MRVNAAATGLHLALKMKCKPLPSGLDFAGKAVYTGSTSSHALSQGEHKLVRLSRTDDQVVSSREKKYLTQSKGGAMKQPGRIILALFIPLSAMMAFVLAVQAQAPSSPRAQAVTLTRSEGQITVTVDFGPVEFAPPRLCFDTPLTLPARLNLVGSTFTIQAPRTSAEQAVTITLHYVPPARVNEDELTVVHYDATGGKWLPLPTVGESQQRRLDCRDAGPV
jgi:hypothetical protein